MSAPAPSVLTLFCVNLAGGSLYGYNIGVISGAEDSLKTRFQLEQSPFLVGLIGGLFLAGAMLSSLSGGSICNRVGRKWTLAISGLLGLLGAVGSGLAPKFWIVLVARVVAGVAVGLASVVCPLYVNELAPERYRNLLSSNFQLSITGSIVVAYAIAYGINVHTTWGADLRWRVLYYISASIPLAAIALAAIMPESSVWLAYRARLNGEAPPSGPTEHDPINAAPASDATYTDDETLHSTVIEPRGWRGLLSPFHRRTMTTGVMLGVMVALTGINAVMFYAPSIFEQTGSKGDQKSFMTVMLGLWNFVCTLIAVFVVNWLGNKPLVLFGLLVQACSLALLSVAIECVPGATGQWLAFAGLFIYIFGYAVGPGIVFWVLVVENFPESIRAEGSSFVNMQQWLENLVLTALFPTIVKTWLNGRIDIVFWCFAGIALACGGALALLLKSPPKKGKYQQIEYVP